MKRMLCLSIAPAILLVSPAGAGWSTDPNVNTPVCSATSSQRAPRLVSDGSGGTIAVWYDSRNGTSAVFAQRLDRLGEEQWLGNGMPIAAADGDQFNPALVSDGAGGAIAVWEDQRFGDGDVFAQRVAADGTLLWGSEGLAVCQATSSQYSVNAVSDGAGGVIAFWIDTRDGGDHVYAQRIGQSGTTIWTDDGIPVCTVPNSRADLTAISDGAGGAIAAWYELRNGVDNDIFAQRLSPQGTALWMENGAAVCAQPSNQEFATMVADGAGGAIFVWEDSRNGSADVFAQRLSANGQMQWPAAGVPIASAPGYQEYLDAISDGAGGMLLAWEDGRNGGPDDIYAQRILPTGAVSWTPNGHPVCDLSQHQRFPQVVPDGSGGMVLAWIDSRSGTSFDVYAQRLDSGGVSQWTDDGIALTTAPQNQLSHALCGGESGGAITAWEDSRSGAGTDLYAQQVSGSGNLGSVTTGIEPSADGSAEVVLQASVPNPAAGETAITFVLHADGSARLELVDVAGRSVRALHSGAARAGANTIRFRASDLRPGMYFARLYVESTALSRKLLVIGG